MGVEMRLTVLERGGPNDTRGKRFPPLTFTYELRGKEGVYNNIVRYHGQASNKPASEA